MVRPRGFLSFCAKGTGIWAHSAPDDLRTEDPGREANDQLGISSRDRADVKGQLHLAEFGDGFTRGVLRREDPEQPWPAIIDPHRGAPLTLAGGPRHFGLDERNVRELADRHSASRPARPTVRLLTRKNLNCKNNRRASAGQETKTPAHASIQALLPIGVL